MVVDFVPKDTCCFVVLTSLSKHNESQVFTNTEQLRGHHGEEVRQVTVAGVRCTFGSVLEQNFHLTELLKHQHLA